MQVLSGHLTDISRVSLGWRLGKPVTVFNATFEGAAKYDVAIPGHEKFNYSGEVTLALGSPGNWQTVLALREGANDVIRVQSLTKEWAILVFCGIMIIIIANQNTPIAILENLFIVSIICACGICAISIWRTHRAVIAIKEFSKN
jgi:hypothetical protein